MTDNEDTMVGVETISVSSDVIASSEEKFMAAKQVAEVLRSRGWEVEIQEAEDVGDLEDLDEQGLFKCVDGRFSDQGQGMLGPKVLGGVYGIAAARNVGTLEGLKAIVAEVREAGYVPSVHGDDHSHPGEMGCGFFKLWVSGQMDGLESPEYSAQEGRQVVVEELEGVYEQLQDAHEEEVVCINFVAGKTLRPNGKRFVVDAWVPEKFDIDMLVYLGMAAETVEKLHGPKSAVLIV